MAHASSPRTALPAELSEVLALEHLCFPLGDLMRARSEPGEVADDIAAGEVLVTEQISGYVNFRSHTRLGLEPAGRRISYLSAIGTHPSVQRKGVARALVEAAIATQQPSTAWITFVHASNTASRRLLDVCGFEGEEFLKDYFGPGMDRLLLTRIPLVTPWAGHGLRYCAATEQANSDAEAAHCLDIALPSGAIRLTVTN